MIKHQIRITELIIESGIKLKPESKENISQKIEVSLPFRLCAGDDIDSRYFSFLVSKMKEGENDEDEFDNFLSDKHLIVSNVTVELNNQTLFIILNIV